MYTQEKQNWRLQQRSYFGMQIHTGYGYNFYQHKIGGKYYFDRWHTFFNFNLNFLTNSLSGVALDFDMLLKNTENTNIPAIIGGNINAQHGLWNYTNRNDSKRNRLADVISNLLFIVANNSEHTHTASKWCH